MMSELLAKHEFIEIGRKIELWGTFITCLGIISIATGIITRMIYPPLPPIHPDYLRVYTIISIILTASGITTNYYGLKWIKKEAKKTEKQLKKARENQYEKFHKTFYDYMEHFGNQLLKGGISFASTGLLTFTYAWIAVNYLLRQYTDFDVYISLIIVTACLAAATVLLVFGEYWRTKAQKSDII